MPLARRSARTGCGCPPAIQLPFPPLTAREDHMQRARTPADPETQDNAFRGPDGITLRRVSGLREYQECLAIQEETWGSGFREIVPPVILMVAQKLGGVCAGAFAPGGRMLGFVFGMTGPRDGRLVHWSDMLAVRAEARGGHIGQDRKSTRLNSSH